MLHNNTHCLNACELNCISYAEFADSPHVAFSGVDELRVHDGERGRADVEQGGCRMNIYLLL